MGALLTRTQKYKARVTAPCLRSQMVLGSRSLLGMNTFDFLVLIFLFSLSQKGDWSLLDWLLGQSACRGSQPLQKAELGNKVERGGSDSSELPVSLC